MAITAVCIDTREPEWVQQLSFGEIPSVVAYLEYGDAMCATDDGQMLLIERKTVEDLLHSLSSNRLFNQLAEMQDQTRWSYLVITGELRQNEKGNVITTRGETGWSWSSIQGALLTCQEMGIFVVQAVENDYADCIMRLGKRDRQPDLLIAPPKFPRILSAQEQIIAALPGIGLERLQAVMQYCGTPAWALVALTDLDSEIPGIGLSVKRKIRSALKLGDHEQIAISLENDGSEKIVITPLGAQ